jgi:polysaccharide biosynthesis protein PslH
MKILWVNTNFLHPTTKGGQIRTLEMLRRLHARHEIHYVAMEDPQHPEGPARAPEYSTRAYPFQHRVSDKRSPRFALELARGLFDPMPVAIRRFHSAALGQFLEKLMTRERFDRAVVDFLIPTSYFPDLEHSILFQHNVETMIWGRHAQVATGLARRWYLRAQTHRMFEFERQACQRAGHIVAVSEQDAETMRKLLGVTRVSAIPTGVDIEHLTPPDPPPAITTDLVFVGSMDWIPNVDGVEWFTAKVLPLIREALPDCTLAIVGRTPPRSVVALGERDAGIRVTGTVPDIRPYLWSSAVSIVPLRIGGGTRLKIYEAMAARCAVVSTAVGAEGLDVHPPEDIRIADSPEDFAAACLELLADEARRKRQAAAAWEMAAGRLSWEHVARRFESIMEEAPGPCH